MVIAEAFCAGILDEVSEKKFAANVIVVFMIKEELGPYQSVFIQVCDQLYGLVPDLCRGLVGAPARPQG